MSFLTHGYVLLRRVKKESKRRGNSRGYDRFKELTFGRRFVLLQCLTFDLLMKPALHV